MLFLVQFILILGNFLVICVDDKGLGSTRSAENCGGFIEVKELASLSVFAKPMIFEIGADLGFVLVVERIFVPKLGFCVGKGTLP